MTYNYDWTCKAGSTQRYSSKKFLTLVKEVDRLIKNSAFFLISGELDSVARLIVTQLAHVQHLAPQGSDSEEDWTINPADGCTNSSVAFEIMVSSVVAAFKNHRADLIGNSEGVATSIMIELACIHHLSPRD